MKPIEAVSLANVNLFAKDIDRLLFFYAALFGFAEIEERRTPIFRSLNAEGVELGFNASAAYELLGLVGREAQDTPAVGAFFTIQMPRKDQIEEAAIRAVALGGNVIKGPFQTYYNAWQAVLADPEGNVFRVSHKL
jgi:predicted enzyme related to lactoylglutathione lyase